jgi:hypothetical protein
MSSVWRCAWNSSGAVLGAERTQGTQRTKGRKDGVDGVDGVDEVDGVDGVDEVDPVDGVDWVDWVDSTSRRRFVAGNPLNAKARRRKGERVLVRGQNV